MLRRSLVLVLAGLALAAAGCGAHSTQTLRLVPQVPTTAAKLRSAATLVASRLNALGYRTSDVTVGSDVVLRVSPPVSSTIAAAVGAPARLRFYDWEESVIGPSELPDPSDASVTGGPLAGYGASGLPEYVAVMRAAARPPYGIGPDWWYIVNVAEHRVVFGPWPAHLTAPSGDRAVRVGPGTVVLQALSNDPETAPPPRYYVLIDRPDLTTSDIADPRSGVVRGTAEPDVDFHFTPTGEQAFLNLTAQVAERGVALMQPDEEPSLAFQHIAVALDGALIDVPLVDFTIYPEGIDAYSGWQLDGELTAGAAKLLAAELSTGPLPVRLLPASARSGYSPPP
ncbi:MAG TPA: hypothetical protein VHX88_19915 [Solirubrobacteraceae bacterium]|nr:hypothetical protein [Solirubrobacteraceae bacterium]